MKNKKVFYVLFTIILSIIIIIVLCTNNFAAYPKLVSRIVLGFESIKTWIIRIATPAAAVAVRNRSFYEKI